MGVDLLALGAFVVSALVALAQVVKEVREGRLARHQQEQIERSADSIPIKGANDAVIALQHAVNVANNNEDRLRARIVYLEKENDIKDQRIFELERRMWMLEQELTQLKGSGGR